MNNYNNGKPVDFNKISDFSQAAKDFAEDNKELEQLLLSCFDKGITTVACCAGHMEKKSRPYIAFSYSFKNKPYIYAILSKLKDIGFTFRYNKLPNNNSFFSIEESDTFDFSQASNLFNAINSVIYSFDIEKNYYDELPKDLQEFCSIIRKAENDEYLTEDIDSEYFQMAYTKSDNGYEYTIFTNDVLYNQAAQKSGFVLESKDGLSQGYTLIVPNRESEISELKELMNQLFPNYNNNNNNKENITLEFEYNDNERRGFSSNQLSVNPGEIIENIAQKLSICRSKGIKAYAIFNGIEVTTILLLK